MTTGINADLEAMEALYRASLVEFGKCPTWKPILAEARRALNAMWEEFYEMQAEIRKDERTFRMRRA